MACVATGKWEMFALEMFVSKLFMPTLKPELYMKHGRITEIFTSDNNAKVLKEEELKPYHIPDLF